MTMTAFTEMLKFQPLVKAVIVIVTSHSPIVSCLLCKLMLFIYLSIKELKFFLGFCVDITSVLAVEGLAELVEGLVVHV